ncbi:nucleoside phosphorylase [Pelagibacterium halotolerans]|uniref:Uridine phosphorylase n=1 Tax=Pelagibacterium halotolerans (strain DSM 22347 / JCM 15775 / CGMCC 1.7692 / B2) TaxID=1082931 RepID=G4REL5_PELHB|nr:nucleoside phosphorylase [Pelagibacterium halotolerans]AEQ50865.1 uridine phosphorylase [Pelagibacterium halotolerans B2]QJR19225.1 nucleoside phosphorylase [Pelagibacterium halotolerans]SDZ98359.1 uridine phosphorylase [Pelagibacterium halotolerans]
MSRDEVARRSALRAIQERYAYWNNVPHRGLMVDGKPAMTQIDPEKVGDFVLVTVRDPLIDYLADPAHQISGLLEGAELIGQSRMFTSYTGTYEGARITVVSGGSGSSEAELLLYDFMEFSGAHTYLRVGGSGGVGTDVKPGDIVVSSGVVREEGMTRAYIDRAFPAASHYEVVAAMAQSADELGANYHVGVTLSVDSDFAGVGRPGVGGYLQPWNIEMMGIYNRAGVLNGDRESAAVVTLAALYGFRGGSVCSVADNIVTGAEFSHGAGHTAAIDVALKGCAILNRMDKKRAETGKRYWLPGMGL